MLTQRLASTLLFGLLLAALLLGALLASPAALDSWLPDPMLAP